MVAASGIEITASGSHSQNFDTLPNTGTSTWEDNTTIVGWYSSRAEIIAGSGSSTTGALYSYGATGDTERAIGSLNSSSTETIGYGVLFWNNSGSAITIDSIAYTGEQWRNGDNTTSHVLTLSYQRDINPITTPASTSGWTDLPAGSFTGPVATSSSGALDGNLPANQSAISINPDIAVAPGEYIMIRWQDLNDPGSDHGLAIDDVSIGWSLSSTPSLSLSASPDIFAESAGAGASTGMVSIPQALTENLEVALASNDTSEATVPASVTILAGQNSATFLIDAIDDSVPDGTRHVNISASASGYTSGNALIQVLDDGDLLPAPTLNPGDIAFTGFNADGNDNLAFVALSPIAAGDVIHFSDNEWSGSPIGEGGEFNTGEGYITWTAPEQGVGVGEVVTLDALSSTGRSASVGTVSAAASFNLGGSDETVYAFQGNAMAAGATGFLAVVANHTADSISGTGLSAEHVVYLPTDVDIGEYTGSRSNQASYAGYLALISNPSNWITQDDSGDQSIDTIAPDIPFDTTAFTLGGPSNTFASWIAGFDFSAYPGADLSPSGDADNDGLANSVENILGTSPAAASQGLVNVAVGAGTLSFQHTLSATPASDLAVSYEWSLDLATWNSSGASAGGTTVSFGAPVVVTPGPPDLVEVTATVTGSTPARVFSRIKVVGPPAP